MRSIRFRAWPNQFQGYAWTFPPYAVARAVYNDILPQLRSSGPQEDWSLLPGTFEGRGLLILFTVPSLFDPFLGIVREIVLTRGGTEMDEETTELLLPHARTGSGVRFLTFR